MRLPLALVSLVGLLLAAAEASYVRDVFGGPPNNRLLNSELLAKAVPLDEYRASLKAEGLHLPLDGAARRLENEGGYGDADDGQARRAEENGDDYFIDQSDYSFGGYSLKYAKCQPVQRFSEDAVEAGEYSPMVVNDIVILRLCPSNYCSSTRAYGCYYDYAEYAIELTDYIRIMLRYKMDREDQLCDYCQTCAGRRRHRRVSQNYYYYYYNKNNNANSNANANAAANDDNNAGDDAAAQEEEAGDDNVAEAEYDCSDYDAYCLDEYGSSVCADNGGNDGSGNLTAEGYLDVIACTQVNGGFFLRPRCDGYTESLSMGIFYDKFCSHFAGASIAVEDFNLGIDQSYFQEFGADLGCLDCSESDLPPYFNANSNLCLRLDGDGARCTSSIQTEMPFSNYTNASDSTQCSFIESIRFGTYDADGQLYNEGTFGVNRQVTEAQKYLVAVSLVICALLAVYSCYLHHAITNLLIKSLSHTDLLPPTRHRRRSGGSSSRRRGGGRSGRKTLTDEDGDLSENFAIKNGATPA